MAQSSKDALSVSMLVEERLGLCDREVRFMGALVGGKGGRVYGAQGNLQLDFSMPARWLAELLCSPHQTIALLPWPHRGCRETREQQEEGCKRGTIQMGRGHGEVRWEKARPWARQFMPLHPQLDQSVDQSFFFFDPFLIFLIDFVIPLSFLSRAWFNMVAYPRAGLQGAAV